MADTVTTSIIQNGPQNIIVRLTNVSDGTGEAAVKKIDATSGGPYGVSVGGQTFYPGVHISLREIEYDVKGMLLHLLWDATSPVDLLPLGGFGTMNYRRFGGITVPTGVTGITGSILFTTTGAMANSSYSVLLHLRKNVPVS